MASEWYTLPKGPYSPTFLKALAMAVHIDRLEASELDYFFEQKWTQNEISKELYKRIKEGRKDADTN